MLPFCQKWPARSPDLTPPDFLHRCRYCVLTAKLIANTLESSLIRNIVIILISSFDLFFVVILPCINMDQKYKNYQHEHVMLIT
jgi:hypothetical protein